MGILDSIVRLGRRLLSSLGGRAADLLRIWHLEGRGREVLLPALESAFERAGFRVTRDDGWQPYDLRISRGPWVYCDLVTVTEYHEAGAALTRVRATSRATGLAVLAYLALTAALAFLGKILIAALVPLILMLWGIRSGAWLRHEVVREAEAMGGKVEEG